MLTQAKAKNKLAAKVEEFKSLSLHDKGSRITNLLFNNAMIIIILLAIIFIAVN